MAEGAIYLAEVAHADLNLSTNDEVVTKLNFSSFGSQPSGERSIRDGEFTITENITALTNSLYSFSGLRSAVSTIAAELMSNNNADESNVENNIPSSNNPHAPSKHRTKKRVFNALDNNNDDGVVSRFSRGMRKVFVRPIRNRSLTLNGEGFNNTRDYKRLRTIYNPQQSNSTSNELTNNATYKSSATDTTAAVEEEEVEFFTENGGFNNEDDDLPGDVTGSGELNDEEDSIKEPMDISIEEESSPSLVTAAASNSGDGLSVANDLILEEDELQSSHFNNTASWERRSTSAGEGASLAVAAADNNVLPAARDTDGGAVTYQEAEASSHFNDKASVEQSSDGSTSLAAASADNNVLPAAEKGSQSSVLGTRRQSPRLNVNKGEVVADGERMSPRPNNSGGNASDLMDPSSSDDTGEEGGSIKMGTVPEKEGKTHEDQSSDEEDDDIDIDDGK